jgi:hypothetical protein
MTTSNNLAYRPRVTRIEKALRRIGRARVVRAFRKFANGVDDRMANERTRAFYRSSGTAWSRCLAR